MAKVFITKKGAEMKSNSWEEGQEISCHENLAKHFVELGIASDGKSEKEPKVKSEKEPKK